MNNGFTGMYMMDAHGNQYSSTYTNYSTMVTEIYGNSIDFKGYGGRILDHRGGKGVVFLNHMNNGVNPYSVQVREEFDDNHTGDGFIQHVTDSYYWSNRRDATILYKAQIGQDTYDMYNDNVPPILLENREFWQDASPFNGKVGVGCGDLATRPATCTVGVAYWATDQDCTDLTGMAGANPTVPISGTLYKCTSENTWGAYYTPYTYPHPLRNENSQDQTIPHAPRELSVR